MDNRYYFEKGNENIIEIVGQEYIHLTKVRRASVGDTIHAICLDGYDYTLRIEIITKNKAVCSIINKERNLSIDRPNITIYLASIKQDALKEALDGLTQLNAKEIIIFESDYTQAKYSIDKIEKLKNNLIQSAKQSERADIPNVRLISFKDMIKELEERDLNIFAYENASENFLSLNVGEYKDKRIALIVGGEGGFSFDEAEQLDKISKRVSMGRTILRAPVAITTLFASTLALLGEWHR